MVIKEKVSDINFGNGWCGDIQEQQKWNKLCYNIYIVYDGGKDIQCYGNLLFGKVGKQCGNYQCVLEYIVCVIGDVGEN